MITVLPSEYQHYGAINGPLLVDQTKNFAKGWFEKKSFIDFLAKLLIWIGAWKDRFEAYGKNKRILESQMNWNYHTSVHGL